LYLSACKAAKSPKYPVSRLLPGNTRYQNGFYPDSALMVYPQARFAHCWGPPSGGVVGWMKLLRNKWLTAVNRIYSLPLRRVNAEGWCSAVDRVEKKAFFTILGRARDTQRMGSKL